MVLLVLSSCTTTPVGTPASGTVQTKIFYFTLPDNAPTTYARAYGPGFPHPEGSNLIRAVRDPSLDVWRPPAAPAESVAYAYEFGLTKDENYVVEFFIDLGYTLEYMDYWEASPFDGNPLQRLDQSF